jgi:hypothetical protein
MNIIRNNNPVTAKPIEQKSPIVMSLDSLECNILSVRDAVRGLTLRLEPVLSPTIPKPCASDSPCESQNNAPIVEAIQRSSLQLLSVLDEIAELKSRLQL